MKLITVEAAFDTTAMETANSLFTDQAETVGKMAGWLHSALYRKPTDDGIAILQLWDTMEALDAYRQGPTFAQLGTGSKPVMATSPVPTLAEVDTVWIMTDNQPAACCFFQNFVSRPPLDAVFDRDHLRNSVRGALRVTVKRAS